MTNKLCDVIGLFIMAGVLGPASSLMVLSVPLIPLLTMMVLLTIFIYVSIALRRRIRIIQVINSNKEKWIEYTEFNKLDDNLKTTNYLVFKNGKINRAGFTFGKTTLRVFEGLAIFSGLVFIAFAFWAFVATFSNETILQYRQDWLELFFILTANFISLYSVYLQGHMLNYSSCDHKMNCACAFISYCHRDDDGKFRALVRRVSYRVPVVIDDMMDIGKSQVTWMNSALNSKVMFYYESQNYLESYWCQYEFSNRGDVNKLKLNDVKFKFTKMAWVHKTRLTATMFSIMLTWMLYMYLKWFFD
jgi:hypothetical protein